MKKAQELFDTADKIVDFGALRDKLDGFTSQGWELWLQAENIIREFLGLAQFGG